MKRILPSLCLMLCLAVVAFAQVGSSGDANVNANSNVNSNVNANANSGVVTREVQPGQPVRIEVATKADAGDGGGLSQWWKDFIAAAAQFLTFVSVLVGVLVAREQFRKNREESEKNRQQREDEQTRREQESQRNRQQREDELKQREEELRWKKAELAREMLRELLEEPYANDAMLMLDWNGREFLIKAYDGDSSGKREKITSDEMWAGLRIIERQFNDKERFIRDCFDALFNRMGVFEHYLNIRLVELDDVIFPFDYYLYALNKNRAVFDRFTESYHPRAAAFIRHVERRVQELEAAAAAAATQDAAADESRPEQTAEHAVAPDETPAPEPAYFLFDCWPRAERYVFMLEDTHRIEEARAILNGEVDLYIRGNVVEQRTYYNDPWQFHIEPSSVTFGDEMPELVKRIDELRARQTAQPPELRESAPRLLAELPPRWFAEERAKWERDEET